MPPRPESSPALTGVDAMWAEMEQAGEIVQPSDFWRALNDRNTRQLDDEGFARFKRTVNQNYFGWIPHTPLDDQLLAVATSWLRRPSAAVLSARLGDVSTLEAGPERVNPFTSARARRIHGLFLALLWEHVRRVDRRDILLRLEEPELGDPVVATHRGRRISQDLCNSVHELYCATAALPENRPGPGGVLELGGGYGRVAWVFLEEFPQTRYILCDIPPALAIAQEYLTTLFPGRRTFRFRHFEHEAEIAGELAEAQIAFLTPNQLSMLDPLGVSLFVNISSLHEMRPEQIAHYLGLAGRHTDGFFYSKQWNRWHNPDDDVVVDRASYPIPPSWRTVYERTHPIQRAFFHGLYSTRGG
ncbi:MAG TPA: putative sugar O-methyltransferase [Solirubrobacteraceae bacterium]|nr:putative sugar O-methyltransferase [Solirubrobacteraceae bacterium]